MSTELNSGPVITAHNLRKMYGPHLALDDINLDIPPGAIGILGPNGAGKSTAIKLLTGELKPSKGTYILYLHTKINLKTKRKRK